MKLEVEGVNQCDLQIEASSGCRHLCLLSDLGMDTISSLHDTSIHRASHL